MCDSCRLSYIRSAAGRPHLLRRWVVERAAAAGGRAGVDLQRDPADALGLARREEQHRVRDVGRGGWPRDAHVFDVAASFGSEVDVALLVEDVAGLHGVAADAVAAVVEGDRTGE